MHIFDCCYGEAVRMSGRKVYCVLTVQEQECVAEILISAIFDLPFCALWTTEVDGQPQWRHLSGVPQRRLDVTGIRLVIWFGYT